jgi:hypothetical protein
VTKLFRTSALVAALLFPMAIAPSASAQNPSQNRSGGSGTQGHDMSKMDMNQMMAHCRQMQGANTATMNPEMRQMAAQCDQMMKAHGGQSGSAGQGGGGSQPQRR